MAACVVWLAASGAWAEGLKRELCGTRLGMPEKEILTKSAAREVSAEFKASLGHGDKMFALPLIPRSWQSRCLARVREGRVRFIEATWRPDFARRFAWEDFLAPEFRQYGEPSRSTQPYAGWLREAAVWQDARTKLTISKSSGAVIYYQVSIEESKKR